MAAGDAKQELRDEHADGVHLRVLTQSVGPRGAVQIVSSLEGTDHVLDRLRVLLVLICLAGIAVTVLLARLVTRAVMAPITGLTEAAEHVTQTADLSRRIEAGGDDEVGRMAYRFNRMLDSLESSRVALDASVATQRQLVADASHELRTPITSLRTNIEVLLDDQPLGAEERAQLLRDVRGQSEELSELIADVIELARGDEPVTNTQDVALDAVVGEAVERARRHAPDVRFVCELEPSVVEAVPERVGRAVNNLLDNAAKYGPPGSDVEVRVADGAVEVRDHGPGDRSRRPPPRLRALLPRGERARRAGLGARAGDRAPGRRLARRVGVGRERARRRSRVPAHAAARRTARLRRRARGERARSSSSTSPSSLTAAWRSKDVRPWVTIATWPPASRVTCGRPATG